MGKKKGAGILFLLLMAALIVCLMLTSDMIYQKLSSFGGHDVTPIGNSFTAGEYEGIGQGKIGDIKVRLTLSDSAIESVEVLENSETADIVGDLFETMPAAMAATQSVYDVDDVSGATVSSHALKEAVGNAFLRAGFDAHNLTPVAAPELEAPVETEMTAGEVPAPDGNLSFEKPGTYTATEVSSIGGDVSVTATFSEDGIEDISCENNETPEIGGAAVDTLINAVKTSQSLDVDMVSGATLTSEAFLKALKSCAAEAGLAGLDAPAETEEEKEEKEEVPAETEPVELSVTAETEAEEIEASGLSFEKPGTYTASEVSSIGGDVIVTATFSKDGIEDISCENNETPTIGGAAVDTLIDAVKTGQSLDVDMVSGATVTSEAFLKALKDCAEQAGCLGFEQTLSETEAEEEESSTVKSEVTPMSTASTGVTVTAAADWEEKYPLQYASYMQNNENNEVVEYTEQDPYIKVLYEGYGFAVSYGSARGHTYVIEDLYATGRPHKLANCFTCKTSDFTARVLSEGDSAYAMEFDAFKSEVNDPFGCFHCHENEPGVLHVTHGYLTNALGEDADKVDLRTQSCGQCHSEYYFDPATKATTLGYHGLDNMNPDDILAYENTIVDGEGNMFADWVDESTGVRKLKAQHPEFETYYGSTHDKMKVTCADCHMAKEKTDDGEAYSSHYWISPLQSESIMENTCAACHGDAAKDLPERVAAIQKETRDRENEIGKKLQELDEKLSDAVKKGDLDEDELDEIRLLSRNAQFYWDFVYVENSEGVHNSALTKDCLDKAEKIADEAFAKLA